MSPEAVRKLLIAKPFQPFRIHVVDGESYEIHHPDLVMIGLRELIIGIPHKRKDGIYQSIVFVSLPNIGRIEIIEPSNTSPENPAA